MFLRLEKGIINLNHLVSIGVEEWAENKYQLRGYEPTYDGYGGCPNFWAIGPYRDTEEEALADEELLHRLMATCGDAKVVDFRYALKVRGRA